MIEYDENGSKEKACSRWGYCGVVDRSNDRTNGTWIFSLGRIEKFHAEKKDHFWGGHVFADIIFVSDVQQPGLR